MKGLTRAFKEGEDREGGEEEGEKEKKKVCHVCDNGWRTEESRN